MSSQVTGYTGHSPEGSSGSGSSYCDVNREYPAVSTGFLQSSGRNDDLSPRQPCSRLVIKKFEKLFPAENPSNNRKWNWAFNTTTLISGIVFFTNPAVLTKIFILMIGAFSRDLAIIAGSQSHKKVHVEGMPEDECGMPIADAFQNTWLIHRIVRFFD